MSRRQSRVSIDARQHDTLLEFETCACSRRRTPSVSHAHTSVLDALAHSQEEVSPRKQAYYEVRVVRSPHRPMSETDMWLSQAELDPERTDRRTQCADLDTLCREPSPQSLRDCAHLTVEEGEGEVQEGSGRCRVRGKHPSSLSCSNLLHFPLLFPSPIRPHVIFGGSPGPL